MPLETDAQASSTLPEWQYDAFLSYSTGADYRFAIKLEAFLERFHQEQGIRQHALKPLRICVDGSDFTLPRGVRTSTEHKQDEREFIKEIIRPYLKRSASLLILWPGRNEAGEFMDWELEEFITQNTKMGWDRPIRLALTRGNDPGAAKEKHFFSAKQIEYELHKHIFYDLRGPHPSSSTWTKVRDLERERFRLAIDLENPLGPDGSPLSADDLFPAWQREQLKAHRSERNLLIFRGVVGFGGAAGLLLLASMAVFAFPLSWLLLAGVPAVGLLGVLASSFRLRSAAAFALAFSLLVPFYVMGSLKPFGRSALETILFSAATIVGFSVAGAIGAALSKQLKPSLGARAFAYGGVIAAIIWFFAEDWRIQPLVSQFLGPWQLLRCRVLLMGLPKAFTQYLLDHFRTTTYLVPLFGGIVVSGFFYGKHVAASRSPLSNKTPQHVGHFSFLKPRLALVLVATLITLSGLWSVSLLPQYQIYLATHRLNPKLLESPNYPRDVLGAFRVGLRCKNVLTAIGRGDKAEAFSALLSQRISDYGTNVEQLGDHMNPVTDVLKELHRGGADDEACRLLRLAIATAQKANDIKVLAMIAQAAHSIGEFSFRDEALQKALTQDHDNAPAFAAAMLASVFYEAGNVPEARRLLQIAIGKDQKLVDFSISDDAVNGIGAAIWGTGIWETLPDWRYGLSVLPGIALAMWQQGEHDRALGTIFHSNSDNVEWFVRKAAKVGAFDAAFSASNRLGTPEQPAFQQVNTAATIAYFEGMFEDMVLAALERNDYFHLQQAIQQMRQTIRLSPLKEDTYYDYDDLQVYVRYSKLLALAGSSTEALRNVKLLGQNRYEVLIAIGEDMIRKGNLRDARKTLALAWSSLKAESGYVSESSRLNVIGEAIARAGDLRGARFIAEEFAAPFTKDQYLMRTCEVYCAILETRAKSRSAP